MAGNAAGSKGGKKANPAPRVAPLKIFAARKPRNATDSISASLCVGAQLRLTILDYYTGDPVVGARAKRVDVEHFKGSHDALVTADQDYFDLPYPPPAYAPAFTDKDEKKLKDTLAAIEKMQKAVEEKKPVDLKALKSAMGQRDALSEKRRVRLDWCRFLQCAVKILTGWRSDKPYAGPIDGSDWNAFEKDSLAPVYRAVTGKAYTDKDASYKVVAEKLQESIARVFITDHEGVLLIPLPVSHTGKVILEMTHLKLADPKDVPPLGPISGIRAAYDRAANDFAADEPGSTAEVSRWRLVSDKGFAKLRNFISIPYDTTSEQAVIEPKLVTTFTMLWCQPTWFETTKGGVVFEPGNTGTDKRGMKNEAPTFSVSSSRTGRGRWYGSWGDKGRGDPVDWSKHVAESPPGSGKWYWYKQKDKKDVLITDWDKSKTELMKRFAAFDTSADYQNQYRIVQPGAGVQTIAGVGNVPSLKGNKDFAWVREWYRDAVLASSYEDAMIAASAQASDGKELLERTESGKWRVKRPPDHYNQYGQTEEFDTIKQVINEGLARKMHHGIDCAGNVGDPVFAVCGGKLSPAGKVIYNSNGSAGGLIANLAPWFRAAFSLVQYLHNLETKGREGQQCKAGDVIAIMGRTGNPVSESPTHTHFHVFQSGNLDLTDCILPGYEQLFPSNTQPKLLPCAADWHTTSPQNSTTAPQPNNNDKLVARRCRGLPAERTNKDNTIPNDCWALHHDCCPHLTTAQWREINAADVAENAQRQKEEAERKRQEAEANKADAKAKKK